MPIYIYIYVINGILQVRHPSLCKCTHIQVMKINIYKPIYGLLRMLSLNLYINTVLVSCNLQSKDIMNCVHMTHRN